MPEESTGLSAARCFKVADDLGNAEAQYQYTCHAKGNEAFPEQLNESVQYCKMDAVHGHTGAQYQYVSCLLHSECGQFICS